MTPTLPAQTPNWSELARHFGDEEAARALLERMRWPHGVTCPRCGGTDPYKITPSGESTKKRTTRNGLWKCKACRKQFTVTVGTVFEDSHIPMTKWLQAIYLLCASKKGISAHQLHRMLGITYKSAWFMAHRLRYAMTQQPLLQKLSGVVEVDETYIGGRRRYQPGRPGPRDDKKSPVMALVERGGRVRTFVLERVTSDNVQRHIRDVCDPSSRMMSDELNVYHGLDMGFAGHESVKHKDREYVRGQAHTNTVEGFFSLLKRGINGVYHHVGKQHLGRYVDEFAFRYGTRTMTDAERATLAMQSGEGKRLTYRQPKK